MRNPTYILFESNLENCVIATTETDSKCDISYISLDGQYEESYFLQNGKKHIVLF